MKMTKLIGMVFIVLTACTVGFSSCKRKDVGESKKSSDVETVAPEKDFEVKPIEGGDGVVITKYIGNAENLVIPATIQGAPVRAIGWRLFSTEGNDTIKSIVIPDGVGYIHDDAFSGCRELTSVTLPDSIEGIGFGAFMNCKITSITLPKSLKAIGMHAFGGCDELSEINIPDGLILTAFASDGVLDDISPCFSGAKIDQSAALQKMLKEHKSVGDLDYADEIYGRFFYKR